MVRSDLVAAVARDNPDLNGKVVEAIVSAFFETISAQLADGGRAELRGFGSFSTRQREARAGRNPRSGVTVEVGRKRAVHFKPGKDLAGRVDRSRDANLR